MCSSNCIAKSHGIYFALTKGFIGQSLILGYQFNAGNHSVYTGLKAHLNNSRYYHEGQSFIYQQGYAQDFLTSVSGMELGYKYCFNIKKIQHVKFSVFASTELADLAIKANYLRPIDYNYESPKGYFLDIVTYNKGLSIETCFGAGTNVEVYKGIGMLGQVGVGYGYYFHSFYGQSDITGMKYYAWLSGKPYNIIGNVSPYIKVGVSYQFQKRKEQQN